jgi:hypothetical protein
MYHRPYGDFLRQLLALMYGELPSAGHAWSKISSLTPTGYARLPKQCALHLPLGLLAPHKLLQDPYPLL